MINSGWFLVHSEGPAADDDAVRILQQYAVTKRTREPAQLAAALREPARFAGLVFSCPRGPQLLGTVRAVRQRAVATPVLALVAEPTAPLVNALHALGVETAALPARPPNVTAFAQRALAFAFLPDGRLAATVERLARDRGLTPREVQLMTLALADEPRARLRRRLGVTENTLKTQIRGLLRKCGEANLDRLAKNILRLSLLPPGQRHARVTAPWAA